jgi:hypothetical protein
LVAAKANQLDLELVETEGNVSAAFNQSPEYTKFNPLGKIPTFVDAHGFVLTEAIAIAIYGAYLSIHILFSIACWHMMIPFIIQLSLTELQC